MPDPLIYRIHVRTHLHQGWSEWFDNLEVVMGLTARNRYDLRSAAYTIAINRIVEATKMRGLYP